MTAGDVATADAARADGGARAGDGEMADDQHSPVAVVVGFAGAELVAAGAATIPVASGSDAHFGAGAVARTADTIR